MVDWRNSCSWNFADFWLLRCAAKYSPMPENYREIQIWNNRMMFDKNRHLYLKSLRNGVQNFGRFSCKIEVVYDDPVEHRFQICRWDGIHIWDDLDTKVIAHTIQLVKEFLSNTLVQYIFWKYGSMAMFKIPKVWILLTAGFNCCYDITDTITKEISSTLMPPFLAWNPYYFYHDISKVEC